MDSDFFRRVTTVGKEVACLGIIEGIESPPLLKEKKHSTNKEQIFSVYSEKKKEP